MKTILLTFDLEEFDLPREFNQQISEDEMYDTSKKGLSSLLGLLFKYNIHSTFFTTANFAKRYPKLIKNLSKEHEIASHGDSHSDNYCKDINKIKIAKQELEKITNSKIKGFRAPRFEIKDISKLTDFGFNYDSSIHPTFIPGKYNNFFKKRKIHKIGNITEIPPSTISLIRLPIFWLAFKNFGINYAKLVTKINFLSSDYTMLVFHPWEFTNLSEFKIPNYINKKSGEKLIKMLENYIKFCKKNNYSFKTVSDYLEKSFK